MNLKGWPAAWCGVWGRPARGTEGQGCGYIDKTVKRTEKWVGRKQKIKLEVAENGTLNSSLRCTLCGGDSGPSPDPEPPKIAGLFRAPGRVAVHAPGSPAGGTGAPQRPGKTRPNCRRSHHPLPTGAIMTPGIRGEKQLLNVPGSQSRRGHLQARRNGGRIDM